MAKKSEGKVFDVAKPGKGKADIGSKPMIVGHKAMAGDPMMRESKAEEELDKTKEKISQTSKIKIEPVSEDLKNSPQEAEKTLEKEDAPKDESEAALKVNVVDDAEKESAPSAEAEPKKKSTKSTEKEPVKDEEKDVDESKTVEEKELDPATIEMERKENLRKLIDSKKYHLNIKETSSTPRSTKALGAVVLVLLLLGGLFYLIDSKTIDNDIELPFSIFGDDAISEQEQVEAVPQQQEDAVESVQEEPTEEVVVTPVAETQGSSEVKFPVTWGTVSNSLNDPEFEEFGSHASLTVKRYEAVERSRVSVSLQNSGFCEFDGENWQPFAGEFSPSPEDCPNSIRNEEEQNIFVFEVSALGAYAYKEVLVLNNTLIELSENANFSDDFTTVDDAPVLNEGVVERIKGTLQQRTKELIAANQL